MYTKANPAHTKGIIRLWQQAFGDDEAFIDEALQNFVGGNTYVALEGTEVRAMLHAVPCTASGQQGAYLYALATEETTRGKGVMAGLMQFAENTEKDQGSSFACLIPASPALFGYYANRGYSVASPLRCIVRNLKPELLVPASYDTITTTGLLAARQKYLETPYAAFNSLRTGEILKDLYASGATTVETTHGYAVYFQKREKLLVAELMADSTPAANLLLGAVADKTGCHTAHITLAPEAALYSGEGILHPHALFKWLDAPPMQVAPYLRFGFEDPWAVLGN